MVTRRWNYTPLYLLWTSGYSIQTLDRVLGYMLENSRVAPYLLKTLDSIQEASKSRMTDYLHVILCTTPLKGHHFKTLLQSKISVTWLSESEFAFHRFCPNSGEVPKDTIIMNERMSRIVGLSHEEMESQVAQYEFPVPLLQMDLMSLMIHEFSLFERETNDSFLRIEVKSQGIS